MSYIVQYFVAGDRVDAIASIRPMHRAYIERFQDQIQLTALTFEDDGKTLHGAIFVLRVESRVEAKQFSADDPYVQAGIFLNPLIARFEKRRGWID